MRHSISLRLRVTLVCGVLLAVCCLLLTLSHNYYAYEMADAIEAIPLQPSLPTDTVESVPMEELALSTLPARNTFRVQSLIAMAVIVAAGRLMVYWLTGKALSPLRHLDEQIRNRTAAHELRTPLAILKTRIALFPKRGCAPRRRPPGCWTCWRSRPTGCPTWWETCWP